jgi:hypothetical protein
VPARCVKPSGRSLEPRSDAWPRGMTVPPEQSGGQNSAYRSGCHILFSISKPRVILGALAIWKRFGCPLHFPPHNRFVSGHDFSRAATAPKCLSASAPEVSPPGAPCRAGFARHGIPPLHPSQDFRERCGKGRIFASAQSVVMLSAVGLSAGQSHAVEASLPRSPAGGPLLHHPRRAIGSRSQ